MTTPLPPPFHNIPSINNLRSATPTLTTPTGSLRPNLLFRSADPSQLSPSGWTSLRTLGVTQIFDLRSLPETTKGLSPAPSPDTSEPRLPWMDTMEAAGVQRTWVPVFAAQDYSPERLAERYMKYMATDVSGFVAAYRDILLAGGPAYRSILLYLINLPLPSSPSTSSPPTPNSKEEDVEEQKKHGALIHCTAGKDRTGLFFALLFDFLHIPRSAIADEYALTEVGLAGVKPEVVDRLITTPGFKKYMLSLVDGGRYTDDEINALVENGEEVQFQPEVLEQGRQAALRMVGSRKESMLATLEMVDREFGGSETYLKKVCGLDDGDLEKLRRVLVVEK